MINKVCGNCKEKIIDENSIIHEAFCFRNITVCDLCQKIVLKKNFNDHLQNDHAKKTCNRCNFHTDGFLMKSHEKFCLKRLITCKYCQIQLNANVIGDHLDQCGSKTELCNGCNMYVMLKDMNSHVCTVTSLEKEKNSLSETFENDFGLALSLQSEEFSQCDVNGNSNDVCYKTTYDHDVASIFNIQRHINIKSKNLENLLPCQFCQVLFPTEELFGHQIKCQVHVLDGKSVNQLKESVQSWDHLISESNKQQASNSKNLREFKSNNSYLDLNKPINLKPLDNKSDRKTQNYISLKTKSKHEIITRKNYELPPLKEDVIRHNPDQFCMISSSSNPQIMNSTKCNSIPHKKNITTSKAVNQKLLNANNCDHKERSMRLINQLNNFPNQSGNSKSKPSL